MSDAYSPITEEDTIKFREYITLTNHTLGGSDGKFFNHILSGSFGEEQFTIIILAYKREELLVSLIDNYLNLPYLHSILIVWNSLDTTLSPEFHHRFQLYISSKRIRLITSSVNSLNNRFLPYDTIETDAILSLDDDVMLRPDEISFAFRVWRENRDRIVGFPARYHTWDFAKKNFIYENHLSCEYSMVLTGAAFYHRFYNHYYTQVMDTRIREKVDDLKNCEDIGFNMMVSHLTRKPPVKTTMRWNFYCHECAGENVGIDEKPISLRPKHYEKRTECLQYFIGIYGYNPLLYTQYRADSVLFKANIPIDREKCYKLI